MDVNPTLALVRLAAHVTQDPTRLVLEFGVPHIMQTRHPGSTQCFGCRVLPSVVSSTSHVRHLGKFSGTTDLQFQHGPICLHNRIPAYDPFIFITAGNMQRQTITGSKHENTGHTQKYTDLRQFRQRQHVTMQRRFTRQCRWSSAIKELKFDYC